MTQSKRAKAERAVIVRVMRKATKIARQVFDYAIADGLHSGEPPTWDKHCAKCAYVRELRTKLESSEKNCARLSALPRVLNPLPKPPEGT